MIEQILKNIRKYNIIVSHDKVLIAVSGGPDSLALLDILNKLQAIINFKIHVAHLDHMFRGEESAADARFVKEYCQSLEVPITVEAINVNSYMEKTGLSSSVAAREVRYAFLNKVAREEGCNKIALGHHADDQAETILMNFMRGSGSKGLKGIELINRQYIRPLLFTRRYEIEEYCQRLSLNPRLDSSNLKDIYLRNKIRHKLIPFLEQDFNPNLVEALNQTAIIIKDEYDYIAEETNKIFNKIVTCENNKIMFSNIKFKSLSMAIKRRLIIDIWTKLTGDNRGLDFKHIEKTINFLQDGPANGKINLPKGYCVKKEYEIIKVIKYEKEKKPILYKRVLDVPGKVILDGINKSIACKVLDEQPVGLRNNHEIVIDLDKVSLPLVIRNRLPGDKVGLLGMKGSKKLKDLLIDLKIPVEKRHEIPLVVDQKGIVWVSGLRQCVGYEIDEETSRYLLIALEEDNCKN